jgi:hypothetical protein
MKYIRQYDEVSDKEFSIPEFDLTGYSSEEEFVDKNEIQIFTALLSAVSDGINYNYKQVPVFTFVGSDAVFTLTNYEYLEKCDMCLEYFLGIEEYYVCDVIKKLKEKLCQRIQELEV